MKKAVFLLIFMVSLGMAYGQRTHSHKVNFSNIDGFSGYVTFNTLYEGFATQLKANSAKLVITGYNATNEEMAVLSKAGLNLKTHSPEKFSFVVEGSAYITGVYGYKYYAQGKDKVSLSQTRGDFTTPSFGNDAKDYEKQWKINRKQRSLWEEEGGFDAEKVIELYLSDLKNEINRILREHRNKKTEKEQDKSKQNTSKDDDFWNGGKEEKKTVSSPKDDFWSGGEGQKKATTAQKDDFWAGQGVKNDEIALEKKIAKETNNQYLGEKEVTTGRIKVAYRDHGTIDGDRVSVYHNSGVVSNNVTLRADDQSVSITLQEGINRISFTALNQGTVGDNTAEFKIYDDNGDLIYTNSWAIGTGFRGTLLIIKK